MGFIRPTLQNILSGRRIRAAPIIGQVLEGCARGDIALVVAGGGIVDLC